MILEGLKEILQGDIYADYPFTSIGFSQGHKEE